MKKKIFLMIVLLFLLSLPLPTMAQEKVVLTLKGKKTAVNKKTLALLLGEKKLSLSYLVNGKRTKLKGNWSSSNKKVIKVDKKGNCQALKNGTATVKFTYKMKGKEKVLSCKLKVFTRPSELLLYEKKSGEGSVSVGVNSGLQFVTKQIPSEKASFVNPKTKGNYKISYQLFSDADCTTPTDLALVDNKGYVKTLEFGGTVYLRAEARLTEKSNVSCVSEVSTIEIEGLTKEEKKEEDERLEKERREAEEKERLKLQRIEIDADAPIYIAPSPLPGLLYATLNFKLYDGNGKDITYDNTVTNSNLSATWENTPLNIKGPGTAEIILYTNIPGKPQNIGSTGSVTLRYKEAGGKEITATKTVRIAPQAFIMDAEVKGIYQYALDKNTNKYKYEAVLDATDVRIKKGDKIGNPTEHMMLNAMPDAYYLLLKVKDSYNKDVCEAGIKESGLNLTILGNTGLEIAETEDFSGKKSKQSIKPMVIDGRPYLTYPLKAAEVKSGELQIIMQGGYVRKVFTKMISDGTTLLFFLLTGQSAKPGEQIKVGAENLLDYRLVNSKGEEVKDYDQVLYHLKLTDTFKNGNIILPQNSDILSSNKGSIFSIRKNRSNNQAEIVYQPQITVLLTNNPQSPIAEYGKDEVTILRGFGPNHEKTMPIIVTK